MADRFPMDVRLRLAHRAGLLCSNPDCRKLCRGPSVVDPDVQVNVGCAAHITAASKGGPRYDDDLKPEERKSAGNGIWLCRICGELIDDDPDAYPRHVLNEWKAAAESFAERNLGKPPWEWERGPARPMPELTWATETGEFVVTARGQSELAPEPPSQSYSDEFIECLSLESDRKKARAYNDELEAFVTEWKEAREEYVRWELAEEFGVEVRLRIANTGTAVLERPLIRFDFPDVFTLYDESSRPERPELPRPPRKPRLESVAGEQHRRLRGRPVLAFADMERLRSSHLLASLSKIPTVDVDGLSLEDDGQPSAFLMRLRHGGSFVFEERLILVPPATAGQHSVSYTIHADNLRKPMTGELPIAVVERPRPDLGHNPLLSDE